MLVNINVSSDYCAFAETDDFPCSDDICDSWKASNEAGIWIYNLDSHAEPLLLYQYIPLGVGSEGKKIMPRRWSFVLLAMTG
jgi:hypothetical protein